MAYIARTTAPSVFGDIWIYLSWAREYLGGDRLATLEPFFSSDVGLSRASEKAALFSGCLYASSSWSISASRA